MYWLRTINIINIALYTGLCLTWASGGWLLVTHAFQMRASERLLSGLATGLLLFITLSNLLAHILPLAVAFWAAGVLIFLSGFGLASKAWPLFRPLKRPFINLNDFRFWPQLAALFALTVIFVLIGRGLAIFDDYLHIPLISVMATGDIPPHFDLDPSQNLAYHYGLQVLAASMVRLGGFFPWSAWDLSKAFAIALTIALAWLWMRRVTGSSVGAYLGSFLVTFGDGARWLLLLIPTSALLWISSGIHLINTGKGVGPNLFIALSRPWSIEGDGPFPFPFAYRDGIFSPVMFALGSSGALPYITVVLMLLLAARRRFSIPAAAVLSLVFASLALSAEHLFVFLWIGVAMSGVIYLIIKRKKLAPASKSILTAWGLILGVSGVLSLVQGAYITDAASNFLLKLQGATPMQGPYNYFLFSLQWPPSLYSGHFGDLSLLDSRQLIVLLAELGPAVLLAPFATVYAWRQIHHRAWLTAGIGIAALLSFLIPIFFIYGFERSSNRLPATALELWLLLGFPTIWRVFLSGRQFTRLVVSLGYGVTVLGSIAIFTTQLISIPYPQLTYFINGTDAKISQMYWNRLPENAQVLDSSPIRSVTLFGRSVRSNLGVYQPLPEYSALVKNPDLQTVLQDGFSFVYVDKQWWKEMTPEQRAAFQQPCVRRMADLKFGANDFRWLLDIRACR